MKINQGIVAKMQLIKFDLFKAQNPEIGRYDVMFEVEGKIIYAHKTMLTLVSDTFDAMLSDRWIVNKDQPIKIKDYSYDDFYQLLTFLYSGNCELTETNFHAMVDMAEFYGVVLFKYYCDEELAARTITVQNFLQMMDLAERYSLGKLKSSVLLFIANNFQSFAACDEFMKVDKSVVVEMVAAVKDQMWPEKLFEAVFKWSEKRAMNKAAADPSLNKNDIIKAEIADFLPHVYFLEMEPWFLLEFFVPRCFIFSSMDDLYQIFNERYLYTKLKVTNGHGQILHGNLIPYTTVIEHIKSLSNQTSHGPNWWGIKSKNIPSLPTPLQKRAGIEWYLVYYGDGDMGIQHYSKLNKDNYIIAEMTAGGSGFCITYERHCKIEIV